MFVSHWIIFQSYYYKPGLEVIILRAIWSFLINSWQLQSIKCQGIQTISPQCTPVINPWSNKHQSSTWVWASLAVKSISALKCMYTWSKWACLQDCSILNVFLALLSQECYVCRWAQFNPKSLYMSLPRTGHYPIQPAKVSFAVVSSPFVAPVL